MFKIVHLFRFWLQFCTINTSYLPRWSIMDQMLFVAKLVDINPIFAIFMWTMDYIWYINFQKCYILDFSRTGTVGNFNSSFPSLPTVLSMNSLYMYMQSWYIHHYALILNTIPYLSSNLKYVSHGADWFYITSLFFCPIFRQM